MFSTEIQKRLRKEGFEIESNEENIWVKEKGDQSVTISGDDDNIEVIFQTFDGNFEEFSGSSLNEILAWSDGKLDE